LVYDYDMRGGLNWVGCGSMLLSVKVAYCKLVVVSF